MKDTPRFAARNEKGCERMEEVTKRTIELQKAILNSSAYEEYRKALDMLKEVPELKQKVDEFRGKNYQLQNSADELDYFAEVEKLESEYREIRKHPLVSLYLEKELAFCRMVQRVEEKLVGMIDLDIEAFENLIF